MAVLDDLHVAELARHAVGTPEHPAVQDQRAADPGAEVHAQHEPLAGPRAEPALAEGGRVGVVVDDHGQPDPVPDPGAKRLVTPGEVR